LDCNDHLELKVDAKGAAPAIPPSWHGIEITCHRSLMTQAGRARFRCNRTLLRPMAALGCRPRASIYSRARIAAAELDSLFEDIRRTRDPELLATLFERTAPWLLHRARLLLRRANLAEDVVQDLFLGLLENGHGCEPGRPCLPYLLGMLHRRAARVRRQETRTLAQSLRDAAGAEGGPVEAAIGAEGRVTVRHAIDALPEPYREVVRRFLAQQSPKQIGRELGRTPNAVRVQLHRGLRPVAVHAAARPRGAAVDGSGRAASRAGALAATRAARRRGGARRQCLRNLARHRREPGRRRDRERRRSHRPGVHNREAHWLAGRNGRADSAHRGRDSRQWSARARTASRRRHACRVGRRARVSGRPRSRLRRHVRDQRDRRPRRAARSACGTDGDPDRSRPAALLLGATSCANTAGRHAARRRRRDRHRARCAGPASRGGPASGCATTRVAPRKVP
jgi:RNA polymerase sigma factor (sigma-70 family)